MDKNLQGTESKEEGAVQTPKEEGAEPTQPEKEPTVKTYTEEDFQRAVSKGLESITRQLDLQRAEASKHRAEAESHKAALTAVQTELQEIQSQFDDLANRQFEDPEDKRAYLASLQDRRALAKEKARIALEKAEAEAKLYDAEKLAWQVRMTQRASELVRETGIDLAELESCQTEEEMEVKALRFKLEQGVKEPEKETQKFDSLAGQGAAENWRDLSPTDKLRKGLF